MEERYDGYSLVAFIHVLDAPSDKTMKERRKLQSRKGLLIFLDIL